MRHKITPNNVRTISPLGSWTGVYFSEELNNAANYGYTFKILRGYLFDTDLIFTRYVDFLYDLKVNSQPGSPDYIIAKLLLNSLYGRFGMDDSFINITIFDNFKEFKIWYEINNEDVVNFEELGKKVLVQHRSKLLDEQTDEYGIFETHNVSIGIASAITAYARIHMSKFKNNSNFNLYYSDTDSIYIDRPLPDELVNNTILGKMKLEYILTEAIFLAPKMYYLETEDGKVIYKAKGLKHEVVLTLDDFINLLEKDSFLEKFQNKWFKDFSKGFVSINNQPYKLKVTDNKRKLIYNENNKLVNTLPFIINKSKEVINTTF